MQLQWPGCRRGRDRGNDARITSNYPPPAPARDYLFMMNPVSRKMESSSGCNVICNVMLNMCILHIRCKKSKKSSLKYYLVCLYDVCLIKRSMSVSHFKNGKSLLNFSDEISNLINVTSSFFSLWVKFSFHLYLYYYSIVWEGLNESFGGIKLG